MDDNKFLLAIVWVLGVAVVASVAYLVWDLFRWVASRCIAISRVSAPYFVAACTRSTGARGRFVRQ